MSDAAASAGPSSIRDAVARRLKRRYAAERRFQAYGVIAIGLAAASLLVLLGSIVATGLPAFTTYELTLEVKLDSEKIDPAGKVAAIAADASLSDEAKAAEKAKVIQRANFYGLLQDALRAEFPSVTDRRALRELFSLSTSVNANAILRQVVADPSLIGKTISFTAPISDDVDLYLKNPSKRVTYRGVGEAAPSGVTGDIEIPVASNVFASLLAELKDRLKREQAIAEERAGQLRERAARAEDESVKAALIGEADALSARAEDYGRRVAAPAATESLSAATPSVLVYINGGVVKITELARANVKGRVLVPLASGAAAADGTWRVDKILAPENDRRIKDSHIAWIEALQAQGQVKKKFNSHLFTRADSREPELAGVLGALVGSVLTMFVTMLLAVPLGVLTAIYLEEFAPKNWLTDIIEVNINNLAAVPSIVFGLLGLAVFINFFGLPRGAPLIGGLVLALMTLPTVIIATRASFKAVPPSIRTGALGVGASKVQSIFHHVLPLAMPGIMTGSIIGLAQALGETAPLLMIGMVAFVADVPGSLTQSATVMPVQIFLWSDSAERAFESRTSAAILVLLTLMVVLNLLAVFLRRQFERRW